MAGSREVAALLDEEGAITARFEQVLREIFSRYATPIQQGGGASSEDASQLSIKPDDMARFGRDTNGVPMPDEQLEEMRTFLDCDDKGNIVFKGFLQMYQLQTESDLEETWRDLEAHGYDKVGGREALAG